jgi:hypothetical protein
MNTFIFEEISRSRRASLVAEAAADRLARRASGSARDAVATRPQHGFWASVRRALSNPDDNEAGFLPRLSGYPTARP